MELICEENVSPQKVDTDEIIWHYTTANVLNEFLKEGSILYGTHHRFLNDGKEISYGRELFSSSIRELPEVSKYADLLLKEINPQYMDSYLFCFSYKNDDLYQWRSYTTGGGFAIGFKQNSIFQLVREFKKKYEPQVPPGGRIPKYLEDIRMDFQDCEYSISQSRERIKGCVSILYMPTFCDPELHIPTELIDKSNMESLIRLRDQIVWFCKHPSFACEKETRIACFGYPLRQKIEYIGGKPRVPLFPVPRDGIVEITVSPHGNVLQNQLLAELLRDRYKLNYKITCSHSSFVG